ncbi:MAG: methyltransferase domain-containing protein [Promethearchaeia archaeon]
MIKENNFQKLEEINVIIDSFPFINQNKNFLNKNDSQLEKIEKKYFLRHKFHKRVIIPIFFYLSSYKIRKKIFNYLEKQGFNYKNRLKIIDISCGYDNLIIEIAKYFKNAKVIANDNFPWHSLLKIPKRGKLENLFFSQNDIMNSNFCLSDDYDIVICKNTMHHLKHHEQLDLLKRIIESVGLSIIIEIENPLSDGLKSFLWNFYYRKFLKDDGNNFLSKKDLLLLLEKIDENNLKIDITTVNTIKGNYNVFFIKNMNLYKNPNN